MKTREQIADILREIKTLPTLPDVATRVLDMTQNPDVSPRDISDVVQRDPAIATRLLKLVNSPFFGVRNPVTSVQQALMFVGISNLRNLVLSTAVMDLFDNKGSVGSFNRKELWLHSIGTALAARALAKEVRLSDGEIAFTAGLIHDVGKVVIDKHFHEDFIRIMEMLDSEPAIMFEVETVILGVDHGEIGLFLAERRNLPEPLREAIGYHHDPKNAPNQAQLAALINVADQMARELRIGSGGGADAGVTDEILATANLNLDTYNEVMNRLSESVLDEVGQLTSLGNK